MEQTSIIAYLNWAVVIFGLLAAFCWLWSAIVKVRNVKQELNENGWTSASITIDEADLANTLKAQSKWSAIAAFFAAIAAICQAVLTFISSS